MSHPHATRRQQILDRVLSGEEVKLRQAAMEHVCVDLARESPPRYVRAIPRPGGWYAVQLAGGMGGNGV